MLIFAASFVATCLWMAPVSSKRLLVWSTAALSSILFAFGLHCHYRVTTGFSSENHNEWLPIVMCGASLAAYALGPLRMTESFVRQIMPAGIDDGISYRVLFVSLTWLTLFGATRLMPGLINSIGVGWVLWYMMGNTALTALFYHMCLPDADGRSTKPNVTVDTKPFAVDEEKLVVADAKAFTSS